MPDTQIGELPKSLIQTTVNIWGPGTNGTGFLCSCPFIDSINAFLVVSNKHVLEEFDQKKPSILLSQPVNDWCTSLSPFSNTVYTHPDENIDLACVIAYQSKNGNTIGRSHLQPLTSDYFSELPSDISSGSKLTTVGYPGGKSRPHNPLIQDGYLVCDINLKDHHLAIKPHLNIGASGSPVFIERGGRFFVLGVVEKKRQEGNFWVSIIIKQRYVSELLDSATESFKQHRETIPAPPRKTIFVK